METGKSKHSLEETYAWIIQFKIDHDGNSPTLREVMQGCGMSSPAIAADWLERLEEANLIRLNPGRARGIEIIGGAWLAPWRRKDDDDFAPRG